MAQSGLIFKQCVLFLMHQRYLDVFCYVFLERKKYLLRMTLVVDHSIFDFLIFYS